MYWDYDYEDFMWYLFDEEVDEFIAYIGDERDGSGTKSYYWIYKEENFGFGDYYTFDDAKDAVEAYLKEIGRIK